MAGARYERRLLAVACRPMLGQEARPAMAPRPVATRPRGTRNRRKRHSTLTPIFIGLRRRALRLFHLALVKLVASVQSGF
jgi:hypothetical protein